tara:strand:- start:682 stop:1203 length:522 start_codon:yes stop_codon:yes gene_type:complete
MATTTIELNGIITWAKLFEGNRDMGDYDKETNGACSVDLIMDEDNFKLMKDAGVRKQGKPDPEGRGTVVKFKRPFEDKFGRDWAGGVPEVFRPDGSAWSSDSDGLIGNGSIGVVFLDVYDTKMGKGCRLSGVQVIDHVPFEGSGGGTPSRPQPRDYTSGVTQSAKQEMGEVPF